MASLCFSAIPTASAQSDDEAAANLLALSTTSSTTTTGIGVVAGIIWLVTSSTASKQLNHYLAQNAAEVQNALATGSGSASQDLAHMFGISSKNQAAFAQMLRKERHVLGRAASGKRDAALFVSHVKAKMMAHPHLSRDLASYQAQ